MSNLEQKKIVKDCWSRGFDYSDYVNYVTKAKINPVKESYYKQLCKKYKEKMITYFGL